MYFSLNEKNKRSKYLVIGSGEQKYHTFIYIYRTRVLLRQFFKPKPKKIIYKSAFFVI